jgi:hypothetical protein
MRAFISHITEESAIATCLKDWIETTLLGQCDVFVSSDSAAIPAGTKWLQEIDQALSAAKIMFVICSAQSLPRPWVNFETGCAWARGIPIVPLCHSGITKATLPRPIADFQAIDLIDSRFPQLFFESLQAHFKLSRMPRVDHAAMQSDITRAIGTALDKISDSPIIKAKPTTETLHDESIKILHYLGQQTEDLTCAQIAGYFRRSEQRTKYFLEELESAELLHLSFQMGTGAHYELNENGRRYLFERDML